MHDSTVFGLNLPHLRFVLQIKTNYFLNWFLLETDVRQLLMSHFILKIGSLLLVGHMLSNRVKHPFFELDVKLFFEIVAPVVLLGEKFHAIFKIIRQQSFCNVKTLNFRNCFHLLFSLHSRGIECLVLRLDALNFFFYFLFPFVSIGETTFVVSLFVLTDLVQFEFFFHFQRGLFNRLGEQNVENGLNLNVVIEQLVVFDLRDFVDTCFLRQVPWRLWFGQEHVRLHLRVEFIRPQLVLLCQEISEVDFDAGFGHKF